MMPQLHSVGRVAGKHGYNGEISLFLERQSIADQIKKGNFLFIEFDGKGVPFLIESFKRNATVVKLADIKNERDAEELEGRPVFLETPIEREDEDSELLGFQICNADGIVVGVVINIEEYPAGPMFILESDGKSFMIPFVETWVLEVNPKKKTIHLDLPEGLVDL
ncbi:MAG: 16S rRNA processing protein RimM [Bacteroidetes bacterium]|nr:16S rRNA processing protein RimM [Bacteroidota bacterium]